MPVTVNSTPPAKKPERSEHALKKLREAAEHRHCPHWVKPLVRRVAWENALAMSSHMDDAAVMETYRKVIEPLHINGPSEGAVNWEKWWPDRQGTKGHADTRDQAPYMVTVQAGRVSAGGAGVVLFDSEVRHRHFMKLSINSAYRDRHLSNDWIHADKELIEVYMTEAQWAAMISSLNFGSGTPATLDHMLHQKPPVEPTLEEDRTSLFKGEMEGRMTELVAALADLSGDHKMTKALAHEIKVIKDKLASNVSFTVDQFAEHMEHRKAKQKVEIEAAMNAAVHRAGMAALMGSAAPTALPGTVETDDIVYDETAVRSMEMDLDRAHDPDTDPEEF